MQSKIVTCSISITDVEQREVQHQCAQGALYVAVKVEAVPH